MKKKLLTLFLLFFLQVAGICQTWERLNFNDFSFFNNERSSMAGRGNYLFFANLNGVYKSSDNGENWVYSSNGLNSVISKFVNDIYADESGVFIVTPVGVYKSNDNGDNWAESDNGINFTDNKAFERIFRLNGNLFVYENDNNDDRLYESLDNGNNWAQTIGGLAFDRFFHIGSFIYGVNGDDVERSSNGIEFLPYSMEGFDGFSIEKICGTDEDLFLKNGNNIYHSKAGGVWKAITLNLGSEEKLSNLFYLNNKLFLITTNSVGELISLQSSTDMGESWMSISVSGLDNNHISGLNFLNNNLIAITGSGLFFLEDGKNVWTSRTIGLLVADGYRISASGSVMFNYVDNGILRSTDDGKTWQVSLESNPNGEAYPLQDYVNYGRYLYAKTGKTLYRSADHGLTWNKITLPIAQFTEFDFAGGRGDTLFLSFYGQVSGGKYFTLNAGDNWAQWGEDTWVNRIIWNRETMFGVKTEIYPDGNLSRTRQVVLRSDNFGQTWEASSIGLDTTIYINFLIQGESDETFYLMGYRQSGNYIMYKSKDNGVSWSLFNINYDADLSLISDFKCHNKSLYMAHVGGVLKSDDGGENWESISGNLPAVLVGAFAFRGEEIYFGTLGQGIWKMSSAPLAIFGSDRSSDNLLIYPNPASDYANVKSINGNGIITILNMQGEVVEEINAGPGYTRIQVSDVRAGLYFLRYESEGKSFSEKLIILK
jgi:photosystem II stability/assembly factor-like uncharacterized protein